jgi:hypothetical protein
LYPKAEKPLDTQEWLLGLRKKIKAKDVPWWVLQLVSFELSPPHILRNLQLAATPNPKSVTSNSHS